MSDIQEEIKIAHRKALEQDFNEIIKELKQEEHKNLELSMRINKAAELLLDKYARGLLNDNEVNNIVKILKGDNKQNV